MPDVKHILTDHEHLGNIVYSWFFFVDSTVTHFIHYYYCAVIVQLSYSLVAIKLVFIQITYHFCTFQLQFSYSLATFQLQFHIVQLQFLYSSFKYNSVTVFIQYSNSTSFLYTTVTGEIRFSCISYSIVTVQLQIS